MTTRFRAEVHQLEDTSYVRIAGSINEDNVLGSLEARVKGELILVDLADVTEINNCGVRDWVRWRESLQRKGVVVLLECAPAMVARFNLVGNFTGDAYVKSIHVPYFCSHCSEEKTQLVEVSHLALSPKPSAPIARCDTCQGVMAFDDLEESYFAFVPHVRSELPAELAATVADTLPRASEKKTSVVGSTSGAAFLVGGAATRSGSSFTAAGSLSSAAALRRLRDQSGVRTHRTAAPTPDRNPSGWLSRRRAVLLAAAALATLTVGLFAIWMLR